MAELTLSFVFACRPACVPSMLTVGRLEQEEESICEFYDGARNSRGGVLPYQSGGGVPSEPHGAHGDIYIYI